MAKVVQVVEGIMNLIKRNVIAKTNITSDVAIGSTTVFVYNTFHFEEGDEIILVDSGYSTEDDVHYQVFEYAKIKTINSTRQITLLMPTQGNWLVSQNSIVQKTVGNSPLYEEQVYYGDREVIATDLMSICVDPVSLSNDWIYIQGGLSEEYKMKIMIYGKDVKTDDGLRTLNAYADNVYNLLNHNLHIDVNNYYAPILDDAVVGTNQIIIPYTTDNAENFVLSSTLADPNSYQLQDNNGGGCGYFGISAITVAGGQMTLQTTIPIPRTYEANEYAVAVRLGRYFYDTRVDGITYGVVPKGSAILRAAELSWWGKEVNEIRFPQAMKSVQYPEDISESFSSMSSSSSY
jgi:hypothetical protein